MAFPAASVRTKDWGSEILTDADLEAQFDILHTYINDSLDGTSGHAHTGADGDGQQINLQSGVTNVLNPDNGGTGIDVYTIGDILYASSTTGLSVLNAAQAGMAITSAGAGVAPTYAGMTTQGDIEYHNGTTRAALGAGTAGQVLVSGGTGANPAWGSIVGVSVNKTENTIYQADTDGFFIGVIIAGSTASAGNIRGYCDSAASPSTIMGAANVHVNTGSSSQSSVSNAGSFTIPVRKGYYYKGVLTESHSGSAPTASYYFIPIGA